MDSRLIELERLAVIRLKNLEQFALDHNPAGYTVGFSGGKDSVVLMDIVKKSGVKFHAVYNVTTVDPPELVRFIRENYPDIKFSRPKYSMWELIRKKGMPPTRLVRFCCQWLKEKNSPNSVVVTGIRWAESPKRKLRRYFEQGINDKSIFYLHPIIQWTDKDVWDYIHGNNLPYCSLYDEGFKRLGCIGCPMAGGKGQVREFARWPKFKDAYLRAFKNVAEKHPNNIKWSTPDGIYNWWISERKTKKNIEEISGDACAGGEIGTDLDKWS